MLEITRVKIRKQDGEGKLKGFATVTFNGVLMVHGIKIVEGEKGLFVAMPSRKAKEKFVDTVHPISREFKEVLDAAILEEYNK
ncbi:MAG: SpoVG family protein [Romboutsia sp.]|nr:SpoVG family protein [Romboutsia sp.]